MRKGAAKEGGGRMSELRERAIHGRTSGFADLDSAGLADSPSTSILLCAACGVSTSMPEAIARATTEVLDSTGGGALPFWLPMVRASK